MTKRRKNSSARKPNTRKPMTHATRKPGLSSLETSSGSPEGTSQPRIPLPSSTSSASAPSRSSKLSEIANLPSGWNYLHRCASIRCSTNAPGNLQSTSRTLWKLSPSSTRVTRIPLPQRTYPHLPWLVAAAGAELFCPGLGLLSVVLSLLGIDLGLLGATLGLLSVSLGWRSRARTFSEVEILSRTWLRG